MFCAVPADGSRKTAKGFGGISFRPRRFRAGMWTTDKYRASISGTIIDILCGNVNSFL
jgi:hypothetical protein